MVTTTIERLVERYAKWHERNLLWQQKERALRDRILQALAPALGERLNERVGIRTVSIHWRPTSLPDKVVDYLAVHYPDAIRYEPRVIWDVVKNIHDPVVEEAFKEAQVPVLSVK